LPYCFSFSSRRRHTRSKRDWSSDVCSSDLVRNEVIQIANIFRATIIDVSTKSLTLAVIGQESKDDALEKLLCEFGILELVRTGMVALERGEATINDNDDNKETDEFDLGKNVL